MKTTSEVLLRVGTQNDLRGRFWYIGAWVTLGIVSLTAAPPTPTGRFTPGFGAQAPPDAILRETIAGTTVTFEMVLVPKGVVQVDGATETAGPFYIGRTEVTWDMYDVFALGLDTPASRPAGSDGIARPSNPYGAPDYGWGHAGYPVISVTRQAAEAYAKWLSQKTGRVYRLPTEIEWRHVAALATGSEALSPDRRDAIGWHRGNAAAHSHPVGAKAPDRLGLFDLFGNAAEWVVPRDGQLVTRGGSFRDGPEEIGPGARAVQDEYWNERDPQLPKSQWWLSDGPFVGFRLVREIPVTRFP
jgi:formylglycine-generating enzyme required for sulfatase activity